MRWKCPRHPSAGRWRTAAVRAILAIVLFVRARLSLGVVGIGVLALCASGCGRLGYESATPDGGRDALGRPDGTVGAGVDGGRGPDSGAFDGGAATDGSAPSDGAPPADGSTPLDDGGGARPDGGTRILTGCSGGPSPECQCRAGESCRGSCSGSCAFECQAGSTCSVQCGVEAQCEVECQEGATCTMTCLGELACDLHCGGSICSGGGTCPGCG